MQATINGFRMNYAVEGPDAAPAVVLHHPLATDLTIWDELTAALKPRYRVVRFDARGHGASEATPAPYDLSTLTADVVALMDHLGLARAHFLGLSMGGMVGQHLGVGHPKRCASLILSSTTSRVPPESRPRGEERGKAARGELQGGSARDEGEHARLPGRYAEHDSRAPAVHACAFLNGERGRVSAPSKANA